MRAYLQLLRLPNVFTAMADIMLGFLVTHARLEPVGQFLLLLTSSSALYLAGMALNDYCDRRQDADERPFRPIPSGRVSQQAAWRIGVGLLVGGVLLAMVAATAAFHARPAIVALLLAAAVLAYDCGLKRTPLGPLAMGACRTLNVLLGMSLSIDPWQAVHWVIAAGIGVYIVGLTLFARSEAHVSSRPRLAAALVVLLSGLGLLASLPVWITGEEWPPIQLPERWYLFWVVLAMLVGGRMARAVANPQPAQVQQAVRGAIFALVVVDAGACLAVHDRLWALAILALLAPTLLLGRWLYST
ncbi:MAG TPA: UbiA family prenyltransferase [Pirellulales bacterium]|jgi:4-hydroxybenzoate polyprenyltransferase|nr:UbiA family prenyltransferase [Pirellulales bacterium]